MPAPVYVTMWALKPRRVEGGTHDRLNEINTRTPRRERWRSPRSEIAVAVELGVGHDVPVARIAGTGCGPLAFPGREAFGRGLALHLPGDRAGHARCRLRFRLGNDLRRRRRIEPRGRIEREQGGRVISCQSGIRQPGWVEGSEKGPGDPGENRGQGAKIQIGHDDRNPALSW